MSAASWIARPGRIWGDEAKGKRVESTDGRFQIDVFALPFEPEEELEDRARRIAAAISATAGIATEDLEKLAELGPYLRLLKLSHLADRQAATMEGAPVDPYISAGGTV